MTVGQIEALENAEAGLMRKAAPGRKPSTPMVNGQPVTRVIETSHGEGMFALAKMAGNRVKGA